MRDQYGLIDEGALGQKNLFPPIKIDYLCVHHHGSLFAFQFDDTSFYRGLSKNKSMGSIETGTGVYLKNVLQVFPKGACGNLCFLKMFERCHCIILKVVPSGYLC